MTAIVGRCCYWQRHGWWKTWRIDHREIAHILMLFSFVWLCVGQHCCLIFLYRNIKHLSNSTSLFPPSPPLLCQVSDTGGGRYCGSLAVLRRPALTWWSPSRVRIPPATCGRSNKKKDASPLKAPVVLELPSRMWPVSALKVMSSICIVNKQFASKLKSSLTPWSFIQSLNADLFFPQLIWPSSSFLSLFKG